MKIILVVMLTLCTAQAFACVTYNPKTGTYVVDHSGNVGHGKR